MASSLNVSMGRSFVSAPSSSCAPCPTGPSYTRTHVRMHAQPSARSESLAKDLAAKEAELKAIFEPGKRMPKAAAVKALRAEVADLRAQLVEAVTGRTPSASKTPEALAEKGRAVAIGLTSAAATKARLAKAKVEDILMQTTSEEEIDEILAITEMSDLSEEEKAEIIVMKYENRLLKEYAEELLAKQEALEEAMAENGLIAAADLAARERRNAALAGTSAVNNPSF